ncbi:MAG TPA: WhiB family transcriptional regulator [Kineosporiaceae bacterium]
MQQRAHTGRSDWRDRAACLDEDPELFFPIGTTGPALAQVEEAKAVCARCPVLTECRTWALENPRRAEYGVFGGMSDDERRAERRRRRRADASAQTKSARVPAA